MKQNEQQKQQGDVTMTKVTGIDLTKAKKLSTKKCILAEGEATGHAHRVEHDDAELYQLGEAILLSLKKSATVTHEEHGPIKLEPGIWQIGQVREWDYLGEMERTVRD